MRYYYRYYRRVDTSKIPPEQLKAYNTKRRIVGIAFSAFIIALVACCLPILIPLAKLLIAAAIICPVVWLLVIVVVYFIGVIVHALYTTFFD